MQLIISFFLSLVPIAPIFGLCPIIKQQSLPVKLELSAEVSDFHIKALKIAIKQLEVQTGRQYFELVTNKRITLIDNVEHRFVVQLYNQYPHGKTQFAQTNVAYRNCLIFSGTIDFNLQYHQFFTAPFVPGQSQGGNLESIYLHELLHMLGLKHSDNEDAIMFKSIDYGEVKLKLSEDDILALNNRYKRGIDDSKLSDSGNFPTM